MVELEDVAPKSVNSSQIQIEDGHLFVLIHGLWGSPNHMLTIEKAIRNSLPKMSKEKIVTLKPSSFRFWKTYDGIEKCAERVINELLYEIETLKQKDHLKVTKISIIGYSLGGLISRSVVGALYGMGFFEEVKPVFFCTFATPHVGVHFFKSNFFDKFANFLGRFLFGYSGLQLFVEDSEGLLVKMSEPDSTYFKGLCQFEKRLLMANVKNDRSVAFYTSFITEYSPFDQIDSVNICYLKDLPQSRVGSATVWPKFIDLEKSHRVTDPGDFLGNKQEATLIIRSNRFIRWTILLAAATVLVPFYIPLILCVSLYVSGYSIIKVHLLRSLKVVEHWEEVKQSVYHGGEVDSEHAEQGASKRKQRSALAKHETFKGDTSNFTESAMEGMLFAENRFIGGESTIIEEDNHEHTEMEEAKDSGEQAEVIEFDSSSETEDAPKANPSLLASILKRPHTIDINMEENDQAIRTHMDLLTLNDSSSYSLFQDECKLALTENQKVIVENLNKLDWIKIAVFHDLFNAHDSIVARRGEKSNPKGTCTIYLWASILRNHLDSHQ